CDVEKGTGDWRWNALGRAPVALSRRASAHVDVLVSWSAEGARPVGDKVEFETVGRERRFPFEAWRIDQRVEMYGRIVAVWLPSEAVGAVCRSNAGHGV